MSPGKAEQQRRSDADARDAETSRAWAVAAVVTGAASLLLLALGFYWDIGWHVDHGRDEYLFTPPHIAIILGLVVLLGTAVVGTAVATARGGPPSSPRLGRFVVTWPMIALGAMGLGGVLSFPIDELWHTFYGIDSTLWSPPHLLMIGAGTGAAAALWFALVYAGITPGRSRRAWASHVFVAVILLAGAMSFLVEFENGAARWQLLYHPALLLLGGAIVLTAARVVLGPGGAFATALGYAALRFGLNAFVGGVLGHSTPRFSLLIVPAIVIEVAALISDPDRGGARFAGVAALGLLAVGLPAEWVWNAWTGRHVWTSALLPEAALLVAVAAVAGALLGAALGGALSGRPEAVPAPAWLGLATVAVLAVLLVPYPRTAPDVEVAITLERTGGEALVEVELDPADAAEGARWFEVIAMTGGGLHHAHFEPVAPGRYVADRTVPVGGEWKTLVRLHRGTALLAAPISLRADPEVGLERLEPTDRQVTFEADQVYMERETEEGPGWIAVVVTSVALLIALSWIGLLGWLGWLRLRAVP